MIIREMSDVHNEFGVLEVQTSDEDKERILILAGDVDSARNSERNVDWINNLADKFKHIIYIAGNHEYYHGDFVKLNDYYDNAAWKSNVHWLNHKSIEIDGVVFWGGTLWTGLNKGDWSTMRRIQDCMNDFRIIHWDAAGRKYSTFQPEDMVDIFNENKPKVFECIKAARASGKRVVVISHHAPCSPSIARHYRGSEANEAYCMYIDNEVMTSGPDIWFHGHTHTSADYVVGGTRVICNPRGYEKYEPNQDFNPQLVVHI